MEDQESNWLQCKVQQLINPNDNHNLSTKTKPENSSISIDNRELKYFEFVFFSIDNDGSDLLIHKNKNCGEKSW